MNEATVAKVNISIAGALVGYWWLEPLQAVSQVAAALGAVFGCIIGAITLYRMVIK